jgi:catechol 2,3-dioxygenase-like lactoylglutathione lyase family enzyme
MASFPIGNTTLLLFTLGRTGEDIHIDEPKARGIVPHHGPTAGVQQLLCQRINGDAKPTELLKQHFCFAVDTVEQVRAWESRLEEFARDANDVNGAGDEEDERVKIKVLATMDWERGGRSVYFEDLDGHVGEIGARGIWPHW